MNHANHSQTLALGPIWQHRRNSVHLTHFLVSLTQLKHGKFVKLINFILIKAALNDKRDLNSGFDPTTGLLTSSSGRIKLSPHVKYSIWLSFYELYNDSVYDLLTLPASRTGGTFRPVENRPALKIREDTNRVPYVEGLMHVPIFNTIEAIKILKYGEKNLQKSSNSINMSSSRSHAIFNLKLVAIEKYPGGSSTASISQ